MIDHREPDDCLVSAGHDGTLAVEHEHAVAIEAREVVVGRLWPPPEIEDTGVELAAAVVERGQDVARDAPVGQHGLDLAAIAGRPLRLRRHREFAHRGEAAVDPVGGEAVAEVVAESDVLAGVEQVEPLAEGVHDLLEIGHPGAAQLGDENLARVRAQLALPLLEDRREAEPELLEAIAGVGRRGPDRAQPIAGRARHRRPEVEVDVVDGDARRLAVRHDRGPFRPPEILVRRQRAARVVDDDPGRVEGARGADQGVGVARGRRSGAR